MPLRHYILDRKDGDVSLPPVLELFLTVLVSLSGLCVAAEAGATLLFGLGEPYNSPFLNERFPDLLYFAERFRHIHHMLFFTVDPEHPFMYPAPAALPYIVFYRSGHTKLSYFLSVAGPLLLFLVLLGRALRERGLRWTSTALLLAGTVCLSYPLAYLVRQANIEAVVWAVLSVGLLLFFSGRRYGAATCFGFVGAMKLYPLIFLGLFLSRRQYRVVAYGLLVTAVLTVFSLWTVYPNIAVSWRMIQHGVDQFRSIYMLHLRWFEQGFDHSLWQIIKRSMPVLPPPDRLAPLLTAYVGVTASAGVALYVFRIQHLPSVNQVLCLTVAMIVLPPTSYDYTLMHLYVPWALLGVVAVRAWRERVRLAGLSAAMVCFGILLAPETEFIHLGESLGGPIKAVTLLVLLYIGLRYRFEDDLLDPGKRRHTDFREEAAAA